MPELSVIPGGAPESVDRWSADQRRELLAILSEAVGIACVREVAAMTTADRDSLFDALVVRDFRRVGVKISLRPVEPG